MTVDKFGDCDGGGGKGPMGPPGPQGKRGTSGPIGEDGPPGTKGQKGEKGDPGSPGLKGEDGKRGEKGEAGKEGAMGPTGERGEKGVKGLPGQKGDSGKTGEVGPPGKDGKGGLDIFRWLSKPAVGFFRNEEEACFVFESKKDVTLDRNFATTLINHSKLKVPGDAEAISTGAVFRRVRDSFYVLDFGRNIYKTKGVDVATFGSSYACLVVTFKKTKRTGQSEYIFSTENSERALVINGDKLEIWGVKTSPIRNLKYVLNDWNTVFIQWTWMGDNKGFYQVNEKEGTFTTYTGFERPPNNIYIGAMAGREQAQPSLYFNGSIAIMDIYSAIRPPEHVFPVQIRKAIMKDHLERCSGF